MRRHWNRPFEYTVDKLGDGTQQTLSEAREFLKRKIASFTEDAEVLEGAQIVFGLRRRRNENDDAAIHRQLVKLDGQCTEAFHNALENSPDTLHIAREFHRHSLDIIEREIVLLMAISGLGISTSELNVDEVSKAQTLLGRNTKERLAILKAMQAAGPLCSLGLLEIEDDGMSESATFSASDAFLRPLVTAESQAERTWNVSTCDELLDKCYLVVRELQTLSMNSRGHDDEPSFFHDMGRPGRCSRKLDGLMRLFTETVKAHPEWPLHELITPKLGERELKIVVSLIGKELGFVSPFDRLFTGDGLAACVSRSLPETRHNLRLLSRDETLRKDGYVRVCGGYGDSTAVEDEPTLRICEFELTEEFAGRMKIKRQRKAKYACRPAMVRPEQLVLSPEIRTALDMAVAQVKHGKTLIEQWGLGEAIPYGRSVTLLFSGPPGVGKTACAEAIAHELGKDILVANYAEIENCWVGETEKNIVRTFRAAAEDDAVLFWDEADSMFFDRGSAVRSFEVKSVNVILKEIERFPGLCILSTNRTVALDHALERRIAIKVKFDKPDREARKGIWKKLTPEKLPLEQDVDFDQLSEVELTGGEIKNVILNAARLALCRGPEGKLTMADFRKAIEMEVSGGWTKEEKLGF